VLRYDIARDIMTEAQIERWQQTLDEMEGQRDLKPDDLVPFVKAVGRTQKPGSSPPVYIYPGRPPLPIHAHGKPYKRRTKQRALEILQGDLDMWKMHWTNKKRENNGHA
jgi:hypothetical protein